MDRVAGGVLGGYMMPARTMRGGARAEQGWEPRLPRSYGGGGRRVAASLGYNLKVMVSHRWGSELPFSRFV